MTNEIIIAGFGGQGILFAGKILAYGGMIAEKEVSWLPSYGPEMRGGTANCNVIISDEPVSSPVSPNPDVVIVMNKPSLDKFEDTVKKDGKVFIDSTLIDRKVKRNDLNCYYIPATQIANDIGAPKLANMVMLGKVIKEAGVLPLEIVLSAIEKSVPPSKKQLIEVNNNAIMKGYEYEG